MNKISYIIIALFVFSQCTPKIGENLPDPVGDISTSPAIDAFRKNVPQAGPAPEIKIGEYNTFKLKNGLQVIVVENHKVPQVSFQMYIDRPEEVQGDNAGYVQLTGELLSTGTSTKSKSQMDEDIDFMGAQFSTNENGFFASSLSKYTDNLLEIAADALLNPSFPKAEFDKLVSQKKSNLASEKEDAGTIASNVASVLNFGKNHPYGEVTTEKTLANVDLGMCKNFYANNFKPNISYFVVVGDITPEMAKEKVEKYFGLWKSGDVPQPRYMKVPSVEKTTIDVVNKNGAVQSELKVTYPVELRPGTVESIHAQVTNTILGGYFRSRLNQNLREDHGYTYGIYSGIRPDPLHGYFTTQGSVRNEVTDSSIIQIMYEMNDLKSGNITDKELTTVKNVMSGKFGRNLERPQTLAKFALNTIKYNLPQDYYHNYLKTLNATTVEDVKASAQKFINPDKAHIVVVGNKTDIESSLKSLSSVGPVNYYDAYGNPIKDKPAKDLPKLENILDMYYSNLGGKENLMKVRTLYSASSASMEDMTLEMISNQVNGKQINITLSMMGSVMQEIIYNEGKAVTYMRGKAEQMSADDIASMEIQTFIIPLLFGEKTKNLKLLGIEPVDGEDAFMINYKSSPNSSTTYFLDTKSLQIIKTMVAETVEGRTEFTNVYFSDYRLTNNIVLPYSMSIPGPGGTGMNFKVSNYEINKAMDDKLFEITK